jgi:hypothetical protein
MSTFYCKCGDDIHPARASLGFRTCLSCGEKAARKQTHCVVPYTNKGAYMLVTNYEVLKQINPKRTTS